MTNIEKLLAERNLPSVLEYANGARIETKEAFEIRKEEIKEMLQRFEYGFLPLKPECMRVECIKSDDAFCAGKAVLSHLRCVCVLNGKEFSFPITSVVPVKKGKYPAFVHINFRPDVPDRYQPTEEIVDRGYAVFSFCYQDVAKDDDTENACEPYLRRFPNTPSATGKIAMWAWAAMRVMDYIETLDTIDPAHVAVVGHSRLGKTALLAGAFDERFQYVISNDSGCSGAAIGRGKIGEDVASITKVFPFWFCPQYVLSGSQGTCLPFDQHFLLALSAPRHLMIGSAKEDTWADPTSEFLSLAAVNDVYALYGKKGLVHNDEIPQPKSVLGEGECLYQYRYGKHYFSREDWLAYMDFIDRKRKK